jgi:hypothetical protein
MLIACAKRLALFLLLATGAYGQSLFRYENILINQSGMRMAGANIYVCAGNVTPNFSNSPPCTLQTVYSDLAGTQVIGQPIVSTNGSSTQLGSFAFTVTAGVTVTLAINGAGVQGSDVVTIPLVAAGTTASSLAGPGSIIGNSSGNFGLSGNIAYTGNQTFSNPGTFSNTQMNNYLSASLNSCSFSAEIGANANATEAIAGCLAMPSGATVNNGAAIAGFANSVCNSAGRTICNSVGGYFQGWAKANNTAVWGINPIATDSSGLTGHSIIGGEFDINITAGSSPGHVRGISIITNGTGTPGTDSVGLEIVPNGATFEWQTGIFLQRNVSSNGIVLDGQTNAANISSQPINFIGYDSGNAPHISSITGTASGSIQLQPSTGSGYFFNSTGASFPSPLTLESGVNIVYRCTVAGTLRVGQLTTVAGDCGTAIDTGLRTP